MPTTVASKTQKVTFGQGLPTVVIGERINPTGRKKFSEALLNGDLSLLPSEAKEQVRLGADILDVNVGVAGVDEVALLPEAVKTVMQAVDVPLCIDSSNAEALEAALAVYEGKALVNSVSGEERSLQQILPLVKKYDAAVVALCLDDHGIPAEPAKRFSIAKHIMKVAGDYGIPKEDLVFDALTLTVGTDQQAARTTLETMRLIKEQGWPIVLGASNVSFGLPDRRAINIAFLAMAIDAGLCAAIVDPTSPGICRTLRAADLLVGHDEWALRYLEHFRTFVED